MFAVKTKDEKKQETTTYMSLTNGEVLGPVELLKISPSGDEVEIKNSGTHVVLNMKDNGFEGKAAPAARGGAALPAGVLPRTLPGGISMPALPGQPGAQAAASGGGGVNVGGGAGNFSGRGNSGIRVGASGMVSAGASVNTPVNNLASAQPSFASLPSVFTQPSAAANSAAIRTGGNSTANNPSNPTVLGAPTTISTTASPPMPPNYTPPPTQGYKGPMPPVPGM
jgi:hypothetical protein